MTVGTQVKYVLQEGIVRPAIVVNVNGEDSVDLVVFTNGAEDMQRTPVINVYRVTFDDSEFPALGTFHI